MSPTHIPAYVIFGATGAGKTSALRELLVQRPEGERWAVLVNDFGRAGLVDAAGVAEGMTVVREVNGCMCCTGQVALRTALVAIVRETKPQRLFVEASAAGEPAAILHVLGEPGIASAVELRTTLAAAEARQLTDPRYAGQPVYRAQLRAADAIVVRGGLETAQSARGALASIVQSATPVLERVELGLLDRARRAAATVPLIRGHT